MCHRYGCPTKEKFIVTYCSMTSIRKIIGEKRSAKFLMGKYALPRRGATELELGGESPRLNVADNSSSDLRRCEWIERDVIDDVTGEHLPLELVSKAKIEELAEIYRRGVWKEVPAQECWERNNSGPISVRWVVTKKGDKANPNIRTRLVARHVVAQFGGKGLVELFAAMPPFEMIKYLSVRAVGGG